jgi:hypothetical protein
MVDIPQEWIRDYVDQLIEVAKTFPPHSVMKQAAMVRAEYIMDLVEAFRESDND